MKQCLIVDDASVVRKVAATILDSLGYEIGEAENGQEAIERCGKRMPDVVLLDWHMPVMGGLEFLHALRGLPGEKKPHVIYCTTENDPEDIARATAAGASCSLLKPYDRNDLMQKLPGPHGA